MSQLLEKASPYTQVEIDWMEFTGRHEAEKWRALVRSTRDHQSVQWGALLLVQALKTMYGEALP